MEDIEMAWMRKYGESKTTRIMMATVPHVTSGLGLRKFQADGFFLTQVYRETMERGRTRGYRQDNDEERAVQIGTVEYNTKWTLHCICKECRFKPIVGKMCISIIQTGCSMTHGIISTGPRTDQNLWPYLLFFLGNIMENTFQASFLQSALR